MPDTRPKFEPGCEPVDASSTEETQPRAGAARSYFWYWSNFFAYLQSTGHEEWQRIWKWIWKRFYEHNDCAGKMVCLFGDEDAANPMENTQSSALAASSSEARNISPSSGLFSFGDEILDRR